MGVESSISSKVLLRHVISILTIISLEDWVASVSFKHESCESGECNNVRTGYPYQNDSELCCSYEPLWKLEASWEDHVGYDHQSLGFISEFGRAGNACFAPSEQAPKPPLFPSHLTFLSNCSSFPNGDYPYPNMTCSSVGANRSYVAVIIGRREDLNLNRSVCESHVTVPAVLARDDSEEKENVDFDEKYLEQGFRLEWDLTPWESCVKCQKSGGKCWRGPNDGLLCRGAQHGNLVKKVAIGVGIAFVILVVYSLREKPLIRKYTAMMMGKKEHFVPAPQIEGLISSRRYTYKDIERMTNSFQEKLGQGGYGYVYKGKLRDGQLVAVKLLKNLKGDGEEFINEVASISRTSHVNIVSLLGFCFEGNKRALVYEFMPNGSLEKFIFKSDTLETNQQLSWDTLYGISLGIARGLEYLHQGCNARILHFDIKPHNILLDRNYCPKISDFGLAKICPREESIVSMLGARGTVGYIAPELVIRSIGGVSHKSDVYSYGMMVLEMVGRRKNIEVGVDRTSEIYFPHWIHQRLELQEGQRLHGITNEEDEGIAKKMIIISLWCIQIDPRDRPAMAQVVEMLKRSVEALPIPPKPTLSSPSSRSPAATTDDNSLLQFDVTTTFV
ncbi:hypothetical protein BT93_G1704 [Corymbia citriodora subsp. variegata]|nr:hypothetical protein BT93_G1704 [Corymbia citriodora subsp. variegata]